jgi:hypothetical protein
MESQRHEIDQMIEEFGRLALSLVVCAIVLAGMLISCVID